MKKERDVDFTSTSRSFAFERSLQLRVRNGHVSIESVHNCVLFFAEHQHTRNTRRAAIIIYALINAMPLPDVNDKLFCEGEETLY